MNGSMTCVSLSLSLSIFHVLQLMEMGIGEREASRAEAFI